MVLETSLAIIFLILGCCCPGRNVYDVSGAPPPSFYKGSFAAISVSRKSSSIMSMLGIKNWSMGLYGQRVSMQMTFPPISLSNWKQTVILQHLDNGQFFPSKITLKTYFT